MLWTASDAREDLFRQWMGTLINACVRTTTSSICGKEAAFFVYLLGWTFALKLRPASRPLVLESWDKEDGRVTSIYELSEVCWDERILVVNLDLRSSLLSHIRGSWSCSYGRCRRSRWGDGMRKSLDDSLVTVMLSPLWNESYKIMRIWLKENQMKWARWKRQNGSVVFRQWNGRNTDCLDVMTECISLTGMLCIVLHAWNIPISTTTVW